MRALESRLIVGCPSVALWLLLFPITTLALTGYVRTHKIPTEEECLSTNVICYECDSRNDPNCADPFDFPYDYESPPETNTATLSDANAQQGANSSLVNTFGASLPNETRSSNISNQRPPKKLPAVAICHGCCVKLTSKMPDGVTYVKRTCTTSIQINYFMVGLVCMKESGDRGKMCFCENDYCNGQLSSHQVQASTKLVILLAIILSIFLNIYHRPCNQR